MSRFLAGFAVLVLASLPSAAFDVDTQILSTRDKVDFGFGTAFEDPEWKGGSAPDPALPSALMPCPASIVIYIHGFKNTVASANEGFAQAEAALKGQGYGGVVIGFSWDSNPTNTVGVPDFDAARESANLNGKVLAKKLLEIKKKCPDTKVNILTHSLGARVALQAMKCGGCCHSLQMLAPAVDNEVMETGEEFGGAHVSDNAGDNIKVWYNDEDDVNGFYYPLGDGDSALGSAGPEHPGCVPVGVGSCDSEKKLKDSAKANGRTPNEFSDADKGLAAEDDHSAYLWAKKLMACVKNKLK